MKKLFLIVFVMLSATLAAQQGGGRMGGTAEERAKATTDRWAEMLTLNAEQKTKISAIELDLQKQMDTRRQNAGGDFSSMRAAMEEIEKVREEKYKGVLTAEQLKKYTEERDRLQRERGQGGGPGGGQRGN